MGIDRIIRMFALRLSLSKFVKQKRLQARETVSHPLYDLLVYGDQRPLLQNFVN